jgi:hypothetical protein
LKTPHGILMSLDVEASYQDICFTILRIIMVEQ